jgi:hypothetical protein
MSVVADEGAGADQDMGKGIAVVDIARHRGGLGEGKKQAGVGTNNRKLGSIGMAEP